MSNQLKISRRLTLSPIPLTFKDPILRPDFSMIFSEYHINNESNNNNESLFHHKIKLHILCHNNYIKLFKNIISLQ